VPLRASLLSGTRFSNHEEEIVVDYGDLEEGEEI
jgi:hypothetical protein